MPRIREIADIKQPFATIGLYQYEPPFGPHQNFRYIAGVEIESGSKASLPEGMTEVSIPEDDYVVITYRGKASGLGQVWDYFHGYWFPQQTEYDAVDDFEFERHDERFLGTDNEHSVFEMHFPIRKRTVDRRLTDQIVVDEKGGYVLQDLRGENIRMVSFQDARLHGIDMRKSLLRHVNFVGAKWEHIYFSNVLIDEIQMGGTVFEHIRRPDASESQLNREPGTDGWVNVEPVTFRNSDLSTAIFENCDLNNVSIQNCRLDGMMIDGIPVTTLLEQYSKTNAK
ncbi:effector binding domain-containing protein [Paenibacillus sp. D2_2]|uniref:effector binding domain-containing protein n=1 Tax=Paenibacillus sp. D2_2 TaxID=3073092 RepID=UPI002814F0A3|nr:effector binding domain-containing protein [Paenibacillus sp. D2_2]WMT43512.1 effector binding domain-containing protein [Paenibacillus sp. D2_2]